VRGVSSPNVSNALDTCLGIDTQRAIVAEIEAEQALVAANRDLIARFENKIQATLARIWGEDESPDSP
jgi:type I restriction enzyme M protein